MDQTRRSFIQNTAILSASAAAGLAGGMWASKMIRTHGPVDIWGYFLSKKPIVLSQCTLASDESQDLFSVCIVDRGGKGTGILELSLMSLRKAIQPGGGWCWGVIVGHFTSPDSKEVLPLLIKELDRTVVFALHESNPVWMNLEDVQKVL